MAEPDINSLVQAMQQAAELLSNAAASAGGKVGATTPASTSITPSPDKLASIKEEIELLKQKKEFYEKIGEGDDKLNAATVKRIQILNSLIDTEQKGGGDKAKLENLNKVRMAFEALSNVQNMNADTIGGIIQKNSLLKTAVDVAKKAVAESTEALGEHSKALQEVSEQSVGYGQKIKKELTSQFDSLFSSLISNMKSGAYTIDGLNASLNKLTFANKEYKDSVQAAAFEQMKYGVSVEETYAAHTQLIKSYSGIMSADAALRDSLAKQTASFVALGINTQTTIKNSELLSRGFKKTGEDVTKVNMQLLSLASQLGTDMNKVIEDFQAASATVGVYGDNMMKEFSQLENISTKTGISMGNLLSIAKKFDTFQGAAESAGKLNAILGGGLLNSSELLAATESERLKLIYDAVNAREQDFNSLSKYEQLSIASAAGINDVNEARRLFNMSSGEFSASIEETALSQEKLNEMTEASKSATQKWQMAQMQLAQAFLPFVETLGSFAQALSENQYGIYVLVGGLVSLKLVMFQLDIAYKKAIINSISTIGATNAEAAAANRASIAWSWVTRNKLLSLGITLLFITALILLYDAWNKKINPPLLLAPAFFARGIDLMGEAMDRHKKGFLAFGAAMLMIGTGVALAFYGMANFAKAFSQLKPDQIMAFTGIMIGFGIAIAGLAVVMFGLVTSGVGVAAVGMLLSFGAAFLLIGAGVMLASIGLAKLVKTFSDLPDVTQIVGLAYAFTALALSISFLALLGSNLILLGGFAAIFVMIIVGINSINVEMINSFAKLGQYGEGLSTAAKAITEITDAINSLPVISSGTVGVTRFIDKVIELSNSNPLETVDLFKETAKITPTTITNVREMTNEIARLNSEINIQNTTNNSFEELVTAIKEETQLIKSALQKDISVDIKLDNMTLGKSVFRILDGALTNEVLKKAIPAGGTFLGG